MTNRLPHWQQANGIYFVTFRLADARPGKLLRQWKSERTAWLKRNRPPLSAENEAEYHHLLSLRMEQWLDAGHGSCTLRDRAAAGVVTEAFRFLEGRQTEMLAYIVMPNHVHALFGLLGNAEIQKVVGGWKGYTSYTLNTPDTTWPGWQKDYFDRIVRNETHFARCVRYIRRNPEKARLREGEFIRWESTRAKAVE